LNDWQNWLQTPLGGLTQQWEQLAYDEAVSDAFGYHALQLGLPQLPTLQANRMPHRFVLHDAMALGVSGLCDLCALPFESSSIDLVTLPHTLELSPDPHATLREVERILVPEGRVVISGFNPSSLWGLAQRRVHFWRWMGMDVPLYLPSSGEFLAHRRLRDWLRLLSFEVEHVHFGVWSPAFRSERWLRRMMWADRTASRFVPIFGALYMVQAVKRVRGVRLLEPAWKRSPVRVAAPAPAARQGHPRETIQ
jgi:SAM-dependent methyltransferase